MLQSHSSQALVGVGVAWIAWRLLRRALTPHPLDRIPGLKPESWVGGSLAQLFDKDAWDFHDSMADKHGGVFKCQGFFGTPLLYVHDPTALQHIMDQHNVENSDDMILMNKLVLGPGLLSSKGPAHRKQRKMLNPAFSAPRLQAMTPVFYSVSRELCDAINRRLARGTDVVDMFDIFTRGALEYITQGVVGTTLHALDDDTDPPFLTAMSNFARIMTFPEFILPRFLVLPYVWQLGPAKLRRWVIDKLPWKNLHILRDMVDVMHMKSLEFFKSRQGDMEKHEERKDILSILLKANASVGEEDRLTEEELLAQITTIAFAATGTTSSGLARMIDLFCQHPDIQDKVRQEYREARQFDEELSYDAVLSLPFLDAVYKETLRVYASVPLSMKQVEKDFPLPLSRPYPATDGSTFTEIVVPKGTYLVVSLSASNRDARYWGEDAREWKPERWFKPIPGSVVDAKIPGVYPHLPNFYAGGRTCIGYKFAEIETKVALCLLLDKFEFSHGDQKIVWKMNGVNQPVVEGDKSVDAYGLPRLQMPVRVKKLS